MGDNQLSDIVLAQKLALSGRDLAHAKMLENSFDRSKLTARPSSMDGDADARPHTPRMDSESRSLSL